MKSDKEYKAMSKELVQLLNRFAKRHNVSLQGHVRAGTIMLWARTSVQPGDMSLLGEFLQVVEGARQNDARLAGSDPATAGGNAVPGGQ